MFDQFSVRRIEGIGQRYGGLLEAGGIVALRDLRYARPEYVATVTGAGMRRAVAWQGQAWLRIPGMSRHAAEVLVSSGVASTLPELVAAGSDDIVSAIQSAQEDPEARRNRIPDGERIDITLELAERWQRAASCVWDFNPSPPHAVRQAVREVSVASALERAADTALGDLPRVSHEDQMLLRAQLVDAIRDEVLGSPTDDEMALVHQVIEEQPLLLANQMLKYLGLWPAGDWLRGLARSEVNRVARFPVPDEQEMWRQLYRGIPPSRVRSLLSKLLRRSWRTEGIESLVAFSETLARALSDPGLPALGGTEGGLGEFDGEGVCIRLVGEAWDTGHASFATADLVMTGVTSEESPWSMTDTAVLSQICARPVATHSRNPQPFLGPAGIAPAATVVLSSAESTTEGLVSAIDRAVANTGPDGVLLVPRTCAGFARTGGSITPLDLPVPANREVHEALIRAAEAGLVVIVPAGLGGRDLMDPSTDESIMAVDESDSIERVMIAGPVPEPGMGARLRECASAGVLVVGTSSASSNGGADIVRIPEMDYTVAGGTQLGVPDAKFTAGWHGSMAAAATAAGLAALFVQASRMTGTTVRADQMRTLLERFTIPPMADKSNRPLRSRGRMHMLASLALGVTSGEVPTSTELATHPTSAAGLLTDYHVASKAARLITPTSHAAPPAPVENRPATGLPTIGGTVRVGETLIVDVSGISDADGLANATFTYQWIVNEQTDHADIVGSLGPTYTMVFADDGRTTWVPGEGTVETNIQGATNSTYTVTNVVEGRPIRVLVSFADDVGNLEALISAPTLMSVIDEAPSYHDGKTEFTFELRFSEEVRLSFRTLRDQVFEITNGRVLRAQRMNRPSNLHWRITVRPDSDDAVTIVLPVTEDCDAQGAICTADGRMLSSPLALTVSGP